MKYVLPALALTAALFFTAPARAEAEHYTLDKPHTQIMFFIDHLGVSRSQGEFYDYQGTFDFDRANPAQSKVEAVIKTASLDMGDARWNEHMKNADFFNVEKFPEMTFKSTGIQVTGEKTAIITGDLTLLGVTKPVALATTFRNADRHPFSGKYIAGFSATGTIKRSDFGMNYGLPAVGDEVEIIIEVEGLRADAEGQEAVNP